MSRSPRALSVWDLRVLARGAPSTGFHPDIRSILFAATTKGVRYRLRMFIDSIVWGWNPSLTSTMRMARSARDPPLLRRDVKEWWPGVSMKRRPGIWKSPL